MIAAAMSTLAHATNRFSVNALSPTPQFDMGSTAQSVTFTVNNTSTAGERIYVMRFRINSGSTFNAATAAPAGWTRTAFSTTSVTFQATDWTTSILANSSMAFTLQLNLRTTSPDVTENLRDARATFTLDTNFGNGITSNGTVTTGTAPGSWTLKSLQITSFQTQDTSGTPVSAIAAGSSFRVVITVKNISNATQSNIVANPTPPTQTRTGTWSSPLTNCSLTSTSPSPLTLAAAASGTMTYTCTTLATDNGTVFFTTSVRNGTSTATSRSGNSNVLTVSAITVAWIITPAAPNCLFSGNTATMTLRVTNTSLVNITSVAPSAAPPFTLNPAFGATTSSLTGPAPASVATLAPGASANFVWTVVVTGIVPGPPTTAPNIMVSAAATYTSGATVTTPVTSSTKFVDDYVVNLNPTSSNASSANQELTWTVTNRGCANVNSVAITLAPNWIFGTDGYSVVADMTGTDIDTWTLASTTFTAPNAAGRTPVSVPATSTYYDGNYSLLFSATPVTTGLSTFTVRVTDDNGAFVDHATPVTVNAFDTTPTGPNYTNPSTWREIFQ